MYGQGIYPGLPGAPMYAPVYYGARPGQVPQEREPAPVKFTEGKLFIGGVDAHHITKDDLVQYCSRWGEVADAVVMDKKNYGFVTFADPKNAMKFLETRVHELKNRRLDAKAAVPKAHLGTAKLTKKMFVGGTGDLTDDALREHFAQFGDIEDAAVVRREGQSRGFGFITFADEISVEKCLLVNHYIKGRKVELKRAVPKEDLGATATAAVPGVAGVPGAVLAPPGYPQPQQVYGYPYGPAGPPPFGLRPPPGAAGPYAAPPGAAGPMLAPPVGDPYAQWYAMGYMPYYHPAAGYGYYAPMMPPAAAGMPYAGVPFMPGAPGAVAVRPGAAQMPVQEETPFVQVQGIRPAGPASAAPRGPGRPGASSSTGGAAPGSSSDDPSSSAAAAAAPAGESAAGVIAGGRSSSEAGASSSSGAQQRHGQQQQPDPAPAGPEAAAASGGSASQPEAARQQTRSSSTGQLAASVALPSQLAGASGMLPTGSSSAPVRRPIIMAYPMFSPVAGGVPGVHSPQPLPLPPRAVMQLRQQQQQQQQSQPQQLPPGVMLPPGFGQLGGASTPGNGSSRS